MVKERLRDSRVKGFQFLLDEMGLASHLSIIVIVLAAVVLGRVWRGQRRGRGHPDGQRGKRE